MTLHRHVPLFIGIGELCYVTWYGLWMVWQVDDDTTWSGISATSVIGIERPFSFNSSMATTLAMQSLFFHFNASHWPCILAT